MCERFSCLPSQLYEEDAEMIRLVAIMAMGTKRDRTEEAAEEETDG